MKFFKSLTFIFLLFFLTLQITKAMEDIEENNIPFAKYGIAIDEEKRNLPNEQSAIRVLFFDLEEQRAEEVNYYIPKNAQGSYQLKLDEKNESNPLLGFIWTKNLELEILFDSKLTIENYIVASKFPIFKTIKLNEKNYSNVKSKPKTNEINGFNCFFTERSPIGIMELEKNLKNKKQQKHSPKFRLIDMEEKIPTKTTGTNRR